VISIVVPIHNEEPVLLRLYDRLIQVLEAQAEEFEIVLVDDFSTDRSWDVMSNLAATDSRLTIVKLRRNFGQTGALAAGFDHAQGEIIIAMDGDLQHEPEDIPKLLAPVQSGEYDIASGWRKDRVDNAITRKFPSRIANALMKQISGVELHDFGTTFKAYRSDVIRNIRLYGELHRFIPALAAQYGARIVEVPIKNVPRPSGQSHYGLSRTFNVLFDLLTLKFLFGYLTRPMHFFGRAGLAMFAVGFLILGYLALKKLLFGAELILAHGPLMMFGGLMFLTGVILFSTGLLGELVMRTYFESSGRRIYSVREVRGRGAQLAGKAANQ
jgi:glycosyltransferase involved in cell wall biosynthesis